MEQAFHILVVDDDRRIRELLRSYLMDNGYRVTSAASAAEARERMRGLAFDLIVLDVMMPGESGVALATALRQTRQEMPILMLSALAETQDRIAGLAAGSDDYLSKPFEPRELLLRIQSLLKRARPHTEEPREVVFGGFVFNLQRGDLARDGVPVRLTTRERDMLRLLVKRAGQPLSRQDLAPPGQEDSARGVDVQINRLRQKIEDDPANPVFLQTVRGAGYALHVDESRT
jgi:two-component system phosphate regulon response regulator OmpR